MVKGSKSENGFLDRFLLVKPKNIPLTKWRARTAGNNADEQWEEILSRLIEIPLHKNEKGTIVPDLIHFTEEAEEAALQYQNYPPAYDTDLDNEAIKRITAKMDVYFLRFCIPLQLLRWACDEAESDAIDLDTVKSAIAVTEFYKRNAFAAWEDMSNKNPLDKLTDQQKDIYQNLTLTFKTSSGVTEAAKRGMAERTFKNWIKNASLFKRIGYGSYEKKYKR